MSFISPENFQYYANYFAQLTKAKLDYEINRSEKYVSDDQGNSAYQVTFHPIFKNITTLDQLASVWSAAPNPIPVDAIRGGVITDELLRNPNCCIVSGSVYKQNVTSIKFYANSVFDSTNCNVKIYLINNTVLERVVNARTIRVCSLGSLYNNGKIVFCGDENTPWFNYIDKGHIIIFASAGEQMEGNSRTFVTDAITLDMNYIIAAASIYPPAIDDILQNKAFIPSKDSRLALLRVEKAIPARYREAYLARKAKIQEDFSKNTTNVMIGKLTRKESPFIELNGIKITATKADYIAGHVTIEANNLAEVVFAKLNPNETEWDIFTLINIYTDWVNEQFRNLPLNADGSGCSAAKSFSFKINDIPLKVSCFTENTRRAVNDHLINVDELSAVLKRASCYQAVEGEDNVKNFDKFISNVSRHSLKIRDIWSNGMPVKTVYLESDRNSYGKQATMKHPKLRFIHKDKKGFYLIVNQYDSKNKSKIISTNEYRIGKFAAFIKRVEQANRSNYMHYVHDYSRNSEGYYLPLSGTNKCATELLIILAEFAGDITEEDKKALIGSINYELSEAEKKSEELLKEACQLTNSKEGTRDGKVGYIVPGKMRTYFVEAEGTHKVYDNDPKATNPYFCVVNKGDMGVGRDALVARIFALHNDQMMAKQIHTLQR